MDVNSLVETIKRQQTQIEQQQSELDRQKQEVEQLKQLVQQALSAKQETAAPDSGAAAASPSTEETGEGEAEEEVASAPDGTRQVGLERRPAPQEQPPKIAAVPKEGGVLLPPGQLMLEPSVEYSRSSALRVAIEGFTIIPALNIGSFEITEVDRDTLTGAMSARLGVFPRFEISGRVPYVYRSDSTGSRPLGTSSTSTTLSEVSGDNIGDAEMSASYQINKGQHGWPFLIGNLRFKSRTGKDPFEIQTNATTGLQEELPTGSGFYALQPSITAILPSDPLVLYGSLGYMYTMKRDIGGTFGEIDPGDTISASFGMGFAVNEDVSFSLGYSHDMVFETLQNGETIPTSDILQVGQFTTGFAYKLNDSTNLNLSVSAGLTDDAPDMRMIFRVPVKMNLF